MTGVIFIVDMIRKAVSRSGKVMLFRFSPFV